MKIAFPLKNETELAIDFAHSNLIGIYDNVNRDTKIIPLEGIEQDYGNMLRFDIMTSFGLCSVVSPYYSYMTLRVFKENNIKTFKALGTNLAQNIRCFNSSQLVPFNVYESFTDSTCMKSCNSCDSSCSEN